MFKLLFAFFLLMPVTSFSKCRVYVDREEFYWQGYTINFSFTELFKKTGHEQTLKRDEADYELIVSGEEVDSGPFKKAQGIFSFNLIDGNTIKIVSEIKTCFTQSCTAGDFGKVFAKAYSKAGKEFPKCEE